LHKAAAAASELVLVRQEAQKLSSALVSSFSELRYLKARMKRLERSSGILLAIVKDEEEIECPPSPVLQSEVQKWAEGVKNWYGDCGEVERRIEHRTGPEVGRRFVVRSKVDTYEDDPEVGYGEYLKESMGTQELGEWVHVREAAENR